MAIDIRNRACIDHADVVALNFVRSSPPYRFRRHFRQGLRSHIMEILRPPDVALERRGRMVDGIRRFPRATPCRMFRIFRKRLKTLAEALDETARVKLVECYLAPDFMARSTECIVSYRGPDGRELMLCGFQEFVPGEVFDAWSILDASELLPTLYHTLCRKMEASPLSEKRWIETVSRQGLRFIDRIKRMISGAGHVPDLAGAGNLIVTAEGEIRLVDINNISPVTFDFAVSLDEKGYPVTDKSIEALSLIEGRLLNRPVDMSEPVYRHFLNPERLGRVRVEETRFHLSKRGDNAKGCGIKTPER